MKRVLNSGYIKLNKVLGDEKQLLDKSKQLSFYQNLSQDEMIKDMVSKSTMLGSILFVFEIKVPVLLLLQSFQKANLGTLETFLTSDVSEAYIPPSFFKLGPSGYVPMEDKDCNDLNTKYSNFYRSIINFYHKLLEKGVCQQEAQLVLPQGLFTTFTWSLGADELITFIDQYNSLSPEMRGYCEVFLLYLEENMLVTSEWLKRNKWQDLF